MLRVYDYSISGVSLIIVTNSCYFVANLQRGCHVSRKIITHFKNRACDVHLQNLSATTKTDIAWFPHWICVALTLREKKASHMSYNRLLTCDIRAACALCDDSRIVVLSRGGNPHSIRQPLHQVGLRWLKHTAVCDWQTPHSFWKMTWCLRELHGKSNSLILTLNIHRKHQTDPLCQKEKRKRKITLSFLTTIKVITND